MAIDNFIAGEVLDVQKLNSLVSQINSNDNGVTELLTGTRVLQVKEYEVPSVNDNYEIIASGVDHLTPIQITVTPKSVTSKLYIEVDIQYRIILAYGGIVSIYRDGVPLPSGFHTGQSFTYKGDAVNHHYQQVVKATTNSASLDPTTFTVYLQPYNGTGEFNYGWGRNAIKVTEVED